MMTRLVAPLTLLAAVACSSVSTTHDYDIAADFTAFETYAWIDPPEESVHEPLARGRAVDSIDEVLAAKGFQMDAEAPDFLVAVHLGTERKIQITDWGYGYHRGAGAYGARELEVDEYEEGTMVVDVVAADTRELVWRGTARATTDPSATPEERTERIRGAVEKVLAPFPPTPSQ